MVNIGPGTEMGRERAGGGWGKSVKMNQNLSSLKSDCQPREGAWELREGYKKHKFPQVVMDWAV